MTKKEMEHRIMFLENIVEEITNYLVRSQTIEDGIGAKMAAAALSYSCAREAIDADPKADFETINKNAEVAFYQVLQETKEIDQDESRIEPLSYTTLQ